MNFVDLNIYLTQCSGRPPIFLPLFFIAVHIGLCSYLILNQRESRNETIHHSMIRKLSLTKSHTSVYSHKNSLAHVEGCQNIELFKALLFDDIFHNESLPHTNFSPSWASVAVISLRFYSNIFKYSNLCVCFLSFAFLYSVYCSE